MKQQERIKAYVEKFNRQDEELIIQSVSNQDAFQWMENHIPYFECPDSSIEETYYFRWWVYRKHIKFTPEGYIITEFLPGVYWAGNYNSINCAAGHHLYEGRWLRNGHAYLKDYMYFWMRGSGNVRSYSTWIADAIYQYCLVKGDFTAAFELMPDLIHNYYCWEGTHQHSSGLFWSIDDRDAMEFSISGNGLRPTLNSYMYSDARAISRIAEMKGDKTRAEEFRHKADALKRLIQEKLWDPQAEFFKVHPLESKELPIETWNFGKIAQERNVREEIGFIPWYFHLPDQGFEKAWLEVTDPEVFYAPFGPTTADQCHPRFMYPHDEHECLWNGPSWPFATAQTLTAMANVIKDYKQAYVTEKQFHELFRRYTASHYRVLESGEKINWLDENLDPFTGEWLSRRMLKEWGWREEKGGYERGKDYNHSTYCDLIISKIFGLEPGENGELRIRPMIPAEWDYCRLEHVCCQGKDFSVIFDRTGERFHKEKGFKVWCDGRCVHESDNTKDVLLMF